MYTMSRDNIKDNTITIINPPRVIMVDDEIFVLVITKGSKYYKSTCDHQKILLIKP